MKRALITGGCGFVGRHFARRLLDDGWHVTVIDDLSSGLQPTDWQFLPIWWWLDDLRSIIEDVDQNVFELIIHCAAVVGGRLKIDGDPLAVATDLAIDSDFFNWVVKAKNRPKVIYFSSSAVYPTELQERKSHAKLAEHLVTFRHFRVGIPDMTYGWAKLTGELLAKHAVEKYDADVVIYRPFSGYGEDQSFDYPFSFHHSPHRQSRSPDHHLGHRRPVSRLHPYRRHRGRRPGNQGRAQAGRGA